MKRNKSLNRKKAISLIVLVITIIIIVIIATTGAILVAKSGIFHSSTELTFKNDMSQYSDRIKNYFGSKVSDENENIRISGENLVEYIPELKDSKYLDKLYVLDGELVIDGSKITEDEKNWAKEIGIHVSDSLEIIGLDVVTTENTIEIKSINTSGNIPKGVKYKFKLDDNEKESTTSSYTFGKLESGKYYLVNVSIVSSEGQELASYKKNIKTRINNDVVDIKLSTENWTKGPIKVTLEYENIPQAYKIQYKIGKEEFKDYTKEFEVTENNTFIYARLYNKDVGRDTSNNYVEIKNIDKEVPLKPTAISATSGINSIKVRASGSQDSLSGILGYKYSLDGITYTSAIKAYEDYTFTNINADTIKTIYTKAVDNVGNESEVYSKDWATWEASEKVKISIDPSEDLWTNKAVTVSLSHQSIPTNYIMQYRINNGSWTDGYTAKVTENRTKIEARLYNKNLNDEIGLNSLTIGNIDRIAPNVISAEFNPTKNTIEVSNIVAKDEGGSGIANYELSIKKHSDIYYTPYTSAQNKYTFEGLVKDTLYDIHIRVYDKAGNVSDYYSKSIPTVCTITLDSQGADSGKEGTKTIYEKYEKGFYDTEDCINKITSISIPQKTGFVFDGYYTEKNGAGTKMIDGAGNITTNLKNSYYTSAGTLYANWVAKKITVIFMRNTTANDTTSDTQEFTYGVTGQSFSAKGWTKKGYTLLGWHEEKTSTAKRYNITSGVTNAWIESKYNASSNHTVTLYAIWQPNTYTVKYNGNGATGGTTANSSHTYDIDKKLTKNGYTRAYTVTYNHNYTGSTNISKTATYSFVNWNTVANGTGTKYANEATVKNLTDKNNDTFNLYAIWKSASLTYVPTRTGYVFDGWFEDAECTKRATSNNGFYTPTVNKTLYAHWVEKQIKVIFVRNMPETNPVGATFDSNYKDDYSSDATNQTFTYGVSGQKFSAKGWSHPQYDIIAWNENRTATSGYQILSGVNNAWIESKYNASTNHTVTLYAIWQPKVFTISLNNISADKMAGTTAVYEKFNKGRYLDSACTTDLTSNKITIPEKTGHTFKGYYTEQNGKGTKIIDENGNVTSAFTNRYFKSNSALYANWGANTYTVKYNGNGATGGTTANSSHTYDVDKKLTKNGYTRAYTVTYNHNYTGSTNTTKTATYSFVNWNTKADATGTKYADEVIVKNLTAVNNGVVNLYAIWNSVSITYVPTRTGYAFAGWFEDAGCTKEITDNKGVYTPTANKTLYAKWIANTYTVKYNGNGATGGTTANSSHTYDIDKKLTKNGYTRAYTVTYNHNYTGSTNISKTATYSFVNWNTAANGSGTKYANEATVKNLTDKNNDTFNLYAIWKSASLTYVPTRTGYVFDGWFEDAKCTKRATSNNGVYIPTVNKTLYAKWIEISYKISYNLQNGTAGTNKPATAKYDQVVTISNPTKTVTITGDANGTGATIIGSPVSKPQTFAGWTYSGGNTATALYGTASNAVTTSWNNASTKVKAGYFKNLTATNNATVTMKANWTTAAITLPKATKTGYTVKWYKNTAGTGTAYGSGSSYSPAEGDPANITFYAKATANKYQVVYNNGDANSGTLPSNQDVYYDGSITLGTNNMKKNNTSGYTVTYVKGTATGGTLPAVQNQTVSYTANGWATSQNGSRVYTNGQTISPYKINGNLSLYPSWTATRGSIKLATNNMTKSNENTGKITFNYNGNGQANTTAYAYTQYTSNGWQKATDGTSFTSGQSITPTSNYTLVPKFTSTAKSPAFPTPTRTGYVFAGWYDGTGSNAKKYTSYNGKDDITLYAHWTEKYILITFYSNGATNVGSEETAGLSSDKTKSTITTTVRWTNRTGVNLWNCTSLFSRTGYAIPSDAQAWILGSATTGIYINQATQDFTNYFGSNVETKINLYANWQEKELRVYFYPNGGTAKSGHELITTSGDAHVGASKTYNTVKYSDASNFNLYNCTTLFSKTGYSVPSDAHAWRYNSSTSNTYINQASANLTSYFGSGVVSSIKLYANWTLATYKITLDKNGGTGGASAVYEWYSKGIYKESSHTNLVTGASGGGITTPTKANHRFDGYYTTKTGGTQLINGGGFISNFTDTYFTSNATIYARWICTHDFGNYVTAGNENHRRTCKICGLTQTAAHQASNTKCNSTTLVIESLIETNTTRYIYEAKCSNYDNCKGRVNYYRKISDGKLSPGTIMNYSKYYDSNGNLVGVDKCPRVKCSVCGAWFTP